jgi:hypothetical protein
VLIVYLCLSEISPGVGEGESNNCGGVQRDEQELIPTGEPQTAICHPAIDSLKSSLSKTSTGL